MNFKDWKKRIAERNDITSQLVHLTKPSASMNALDVLIKILNDECIEGSTTESGFICGNKRAVCLQDTPLYSLTQNIYYEQKLRENDENRKIRYLGFGLLFSKSYVYKNNGRPVIYDRTEDAKMYLPHNEWWRIVNLDLSDEKNFIDWTHEREWRVPDKLKFDLSQVSILVPNAKVYKKFLKKCKDNNIDILNKVESVINLGALFY
ncbi:hypothetical protein [Clostridium ihumii]|uniref:hypothetical protein n=1 Tax=Clostridium ihumii TaxID=1470356 RepID=UPI0005586EB8|nr:hypothetical protein [Clostridium ihumii]